MRSLAAEALRHRWPVAGAVAAAIAFAVGYVLVRPIGANPVGFDTAQSVLYFQRIIAGTPLEQLGGATPKPLLTVVDGVLHLVGGWRAVSLAAVASFAAVVGLGTELARRHAGPISAAFAFVALVGSRPLLVDATLAYAVSWAAIGCLIAAFAVAAARPHYIVAGVAMALATLARLEIAAVVAGALVVLAVLRFGPWWPTRHPPNGAWWLALGLAALPVMLIHDWLLIGDPMYWAGVSARFSEAHPEAVLSPVQLVDFFRRHFSGMALMTLLAVGGVFVTLHRRQWAIAAGFVLIGLGVPAFFVILAARGTFFSSRYVAIADLAVAVAAAFGTSLVSLPELDSPPSEDRWLRRARAAAGLALAGLIALMASVPFAPLSPSSRGEAFRQRAVAQNVQAVVPILRSAIAAPGSTGGTAPRVVVPGLWQPRLVVDLGLRMPEVVFANVTPDGASFLPDAFVPGELVYHDRIADPAAFKPLETDVPVDLDGVRFVPVASDPAAGWWVHRVEAQH
jgi:hypothetical protein